MYLKASPQTSWGKRTIPFPLVFPSARLTNQKLYIWQGHPVRQSVSQSVAGGDSPGTRSQLDTLVLSRDAIHDLQAEEEMGEGGPNTSLIWQATKFGHLHKRQGVQFSISKMNYLLNRT